MLLLLDEVHAWGHIATVHYTHAPRAAAAQICLSSRTDFTELEPGHTIFRAAALFTSIVAGGVETDLLGPPLHGPAQVHAKDLSEIRGRLMAENCGARAVVSQFHCMASTPAPEFIAAPAASRLVAFILPSNGAIQYKHIVKVFAGGRAVSEQEAIDTARANAKGFALDLARLEMKLASETATAAAAQRFDLDTGEFVSSPV